MRSIRKLALPSGVAALAVVTAACGSGGGSSGAYGRTGSATTNRTNGERAQADVQPAATANTVAVAASPLGQLLVDGNGLTLYLFEADTTSDSTCYGACAQTWPPLVTAGSPQSGPNLNRADLATTRRHDGTDQVTYHGHPLYYFAGDTKAGDTSGQRLRSFGASWYVVGADGTKIDNS